MSKVENFWSERIPITRAFFAIFLSILLISGSGLMIELYYLHVKQHRYQNEKYTIKALIPVTSSKDQLQIKLLKELLGLSNVRSAQLYRFNTKRAEQKLLSFPLIKKVTIKKKHPDTLLIEYQLREPVAYLGGYENTAIDSSGVLIPIEPYLSPKEWPMLYFFTPYSKKKTILGYANRSR